MCRPKERRGLVLIDPSFEDAADFTRLFAALVTADRKRPTGIYMLWYPIKGRRLPMRWRTSCESLRCQSFIAANSRSVRRVPMPVSSGLA
jgi:23S rRNA A2030 N6-methylase RlmJ